MNISTKETLTVGLDVERLHDNQLWIFTLIKSPTRAVADAWYAGVLDYIKTHAETTDRWLIYDLSQSSALSLTPYLKERSSKISDSDPNATGRTAIVLPIFGPIRMMIEFFIQMTAKRKQPHSDMRIFHTRHEALAWVEAGMKST